MLRIKKSFDNKKLICVSKGVEDDLLTNISAQPAFVKTIYNPFDFKKINKLSNVVNSDIPVDDYIIHVGRFELGHKRQDVLLKAYKKSNIKHKLVLLGDGQNRKEIESLNIFLDLQEKVLLPGFVSNPYNWIKNAKLFVFASDYEGFGNVLVESLSLKVPVVSTNCASGPCEILKYELSDYLVDTGDIEGLAEKMQSALIHYPEIESKHIEDFEITKIIDQYAQLINP
jgi:glycosyltransferase involved in cell wall biosynthesis